MKVSRKRRGFTAMPVLVLALALTAGLVVVGCGSGQDSSGELGGSDTGLQSAKLIGAGASFPYPVYVEWIGGFMQAYPQITVDYTAIGSGAGIQQFTDQSTDFGGTDAFMDEEEIADAEAANALGANVIQIPTVFGAVVLAYNVPGVDSLKLDSDAIADIFLGNITNWNDPALAALNPDIQLPDDNVEVVHRSDSSGTTNAFTGYLASVSTEWADKVGSGKEVQWPTGVGGPKNDGVAATIDQTENSIGYVELAYAVLNGMSTADVKNSSGNFITPSLESTSAAAAVDVIPDDLNLEVANSPVADAYPIVTATYMMAYDRMDDFDKAAALKAFLIWALSDEGSQIAEDLGYASLPDSVRDAALEKIELIGS